METSTRSSHHSAASLSARLIAKLIDITLVAAVIAPFSLLAIDRIGLVALGLTIPVVLLILALYTAGSERRAGCTLGKRVMGLRVVSESGGPISLGQAFARQLPLLTDNVGLDAIAVLFTRDHQRLFELASRTRVVVA